jgi:DNA-binding CsgD family transcriptional regulator
MSESARAAAGKFLAAVDAIYTAATEPALWPQALQASADVFDDVGANLLWRRDDGSLGVILSPGLSPQSATEYHDKWWPQDIRAHRSVERFFQNPGNALTDRHVVTPKEMDCHPIYTEFLSKQGLQWVAGTFVSPDPRTFVSMSIQRAIGKVPFSDDELDVLSKLAIHVERSLRLSIRLLEAELSNVGLGEALARIGIGVFALDSLKRIVFSNPAGERLLGDGLAVVNQRLLASAHASELNALIERMIRANPADIAESPKPILIPRRRAERPLAVYVLPIANSISPAVEFLTHTRAIVLVIDPSGSEPADPTVVRDLLGLTLSEARIASLVGSGLSPASAAEKLGITEETARSALKRVFAKTGVSRQNELAALLAKLVLR